MTAMSQLTLRLCESDLMSAYSGLLRLAEFVTAGKLNDLIYQHGVLVSGYQVNWCIVKLGVFSSALAF